MPAIQAARIMAVLQAHGHHGRQVQDHILVYEDLYDPALGSCVQEPAKLRTLAQAMAWLGY